MLDLFNNYTIYILNKVIMEKKFSYDEPKNSLNNRIKAHLSFSNFNLHEWVKTNQNILSGDKILDMGCGNGNFLELFLKMTNKKSEIYAVDKNKDLILEASEKFKNENITFEVNDFDNVEIENKKFDWIFFIYSIYYTENSDKLIKKIKSYLNKKGKLVIIGPGSGNAMEIDRLNRKVTSLEPKEEYRVRQKRIEDEFKPVLEKYFDKKHTNLEIINNEMKFPTKEDLADYYWSTLLWRDSLERLENYDLQALKESTLNEISKLDNLIIKKQICCLSGIN